jgi:GntR family transcriptional regulator
MSRDEVRGKHVALTAGVPLHRQLFLVLHDEIARGAIPAGDPLPTEQELCDQFGVSRITVRRALADLADQGYITRRQGVGSFVRQHSPTGRHAASRSYMDELRQIHFESDPGVLEFDLRAAPKIIADKVGLAGEVLHILRVRRERRTGEPLLVTEAWLPASLAETITAEKLVHAPLYRLLAEAGVTLERVQHEFIAEIASPRTAQLLDIAIGAAVQRVNRLAFIDGDRPHHYLSILLSPSRSRILLNHSAPELEIGDTMAITHDVRPEASPSRPAIIPLRPGPG